MLFFNKVNISLNVIAMENDDTVLSGARLPRRSSLFEVSEGDIPDIAMRNRNEES